MAALCSFLRHSRECGNPEISFGVQALLKRASRTLNDWIPACAGMTGKLQPTRPHRVSGPARLHGSAKSCARLFNRPTRRLLSMPRAGSLLEHIRFLLPFDPCGIRFHRVLDHAFLRSAQTASQGTDTMDDRFIHPHRQYLVHQFPITFIVHTISKRLQPKGEIA